MLKKLQNKTVFNVVNGLELLFGLIFLLSAVSDIQFGFALVLIFDAIKSWTK